MITLPDCPKRSKVGHRCGDCAGCLETRKTLWRLFDKGNGPTEVANLTGLPRTNVQSYSNRWAAERGKDVAPRWKKAGNGAYWEISEPVVQRPTCTCGLSIDKDHGPDNCDFGLKSTGLGTWSGVSW